MNTYQIILDDSNYPLLNIDDQTVFVKAVMLSYEQ